VNGDDFRLALEDFKRARRRASLQHVMAKLTGRSDRLLSYEEAREKLRGLESARQTLSSVPIDAIVGTVGRYSDFTRQFLPRQDSDAVRWARVKLMMTEQAGLPPVELYRIGDAYFVKDGHHRVSVARELGATHIEAYVTDVRTKVPLSPDVSPDDLIIKAEYTAFLEDTRLNELRPQADLTVTVPGQYQVLKEHIDVHRYFMGLEQRREIPYHEAVSDWYDEVYLPVVRIIRGRDMLRDFPGRTETDLYLWLAEHRAALEAELGWLVEPADAAADLAARSGRSLRRVLARVTERVINAVMPEELSGGPTPGEWRQEQLAAHRDDRLFAHVLVPLSGKWATWRALEQALEIARREEAHLHGLHVVGAQVEKDGREAITVRDEFNRRCEKAGVWGKLTVDVGRVSHRVVEYARWVDLVVVNLAYPPPLTPLARLSWGLRVMIRRSPSPVLIVPGIPSAMKRALLAYDGSPKAEEALFVAAYLASRWQIALAVLTVLEGGRTTSDTLARARTYLEGRNVQAAYVQRSGPVAKAVLEVSAELNNDLIIMGGYGFSPVLEVVLGSSVDQVLRKSQQPVLVCQ